MQVVNNDFKMLYIIMPLTFKPNVYGTKKVSGDFGFIHKS